MFTVGQPRTWTMTSKVHLTKRRNGYYSIGRFEGNRASGNPQRHAQPQPMRCSTSAISREPQKRLNRLPWTVLKMNNATFGA